MRNSATSTVNNTPGPILANISTFVAKATATAAEKYARGLNITNITMFVA